MHLQEFINAIPHASYAPQTLMELAKNHGAHALNFSEEWKLQPCQTYYITHENAICFIKTPPSIGPYKACGAHIDSPCLHIKSRSFRVQNGFETFSTEVYGSPLISTWVDRELSLVGMVYTNDKIIALPIGLLKGFIPNLAIHLNRDFNKGFEYNAQKHLQIILSQKTGAKTYEDFIQWLGNELKIDAKTIQGFELFTSSQASSIETQGLIHSPRLDNLSGTHAIFEAFFKSESQNLNFAIFFDHEEIGSVSSSGAASSLFQNIVERTYHGLGASRADFLRYGPDSAFLSVDASHGVHPAYSEKLDGDYAPELGKGFAIKANINHRYSGSAAFLYQLENTWKKHKINYQFFTNRADMACGSTIGPFIESLGLQRTLDIGIPLLSMHSALETADLSDHESIIRALTIFYEEEL